MTEGYPSHWLHGQIHLNPATGELHTNEPSGEDGVEGPHPIRQWLTSHLRTGPNLFMSGDFQLRAGGRSAWKLECDALTPADWAGLAVMASEILIPFGHVVGVPRGGVPFADALRKYATGNHVDGLLIAEDVCTTGGSMTRFMESLPKSQLEHGYTGVCAFARETQWPEWVIPLFAFHPMAVLANERMRMRFGRDRK